MYSCDLTISLFRPYLQQPYHLGKEAIEVTIEYLDCLTRSSLRLHRSVVAESNALTSTNALVDETALKCAR